MVSGEEENKRSAVSENQKNFRRMLRILKLPTALTNAVSSTQMTAPTLTKEQECE